MARFGSAADAPVASAAPSGTRYGAAGDAPAGKVSRARQRGRDAARSGLSGKALGFFQNVAENVPGLDEADAAINFVAPRLLGDAIHGRLNLSNIGEKATTAWRDARDEQRGVLEASKADAPTLSSLGAGTGLAIQAVPLFMTGGATAAPQAAAAGARVSIGRRAANMAMTGLKNATVGGTYAAANELAGRGSAPERLASASEVALTGAAVGAGLPVAGAGLRGLMTGAGKVAGPLARTTVRAVNHVADRNAVNGAFLDPEKEVIGRVVEMMRRDRLTPETMNAALAEWNRVGGPSPAFMDIIAREGGGQNTMALFRGGALTGPGRNVASRYGMRVAGDLQDFATERTARLPGDPRTAPQIETSAAGRLAEASQPPAYTPGGAGSATSARLTEGRAAAKRVVDDAYGAARAAAPEGAHISSAEFPQMRANIREAVRDFHPQDVPSVARELDALDTLSTPTIRDLYEARQRLTAVRLSKPEQARAAAQAVRAIDAEIEGAVQRGSVTGDPQVVDLWRNAIAQRREFGRAWEGSDLIDELSAQEYRGGGQVNAIAPEDASRRMFGAGTGVTVRPDLARDFARLRDRLGADSAEWAAVQQEAVGRILQRDAGSETYGAAWDAFSRQNPELAALLMNGEQRAALTQAGARVRGAVADREAVATGRRIMQTPSSAYPDALEATQGRFPLTQSGARTQMIDTIERPPENATGVLNTIGSSTRMTNNLASTFGEQTGGDYQAAIRAAIEQIQNARFINPNTGAPTAGRLADETFVEGIPTSPGGLLTWLQQKLKGGLTLTDTERELLTQLATGGAGDVMERVIPRLIQSSPVRMIRPPVSPAAAPLIAHDSNR